jgi:hypothetical protein
LPADNGLTWESVRLLVPASAKENSMAVAFDDRPESFLKRLRGMTDAQLVSYGKACRRMASPGATYGARDESAIYQLQKCVEEWRRRYPVPLNVETLKKLRDREEIVTPDFEELKKDWPE